jgi:hypothetical protein
MHVRFVLKSLLMQVLIFFLSGTETLLVSFIILEFLNDLIFGIGGSNKLVRDHYFVKAALIKQLVILLIANFSLFAFF